MGTFSNFNDERPHRVWDGVVARVHGGDRVMMALVDLEPNQPVPEHHHDNEQVGFVLKGSLEFTIGGETRALRPGDTYVIPGDVPHAVVTGPQGAVVCDIFAPPRADWANLDRDDPSPSSWSPAAERG